MLWLTANIHGSEVAGLAAIHEVLTPDLPRRLHGAIVACRRSIPAGLRVGDRRPYYDDHDPNRLFPQRREPGEYDEDDAFPSPYSIVAHQIGAAMRGTADYLIDLHCAWTLSIPFNIRDRVLLSRRARAPAG